MRQPVCRVDSVLELEQDHRTITAVAQPVRNYA